MRYNVAVIGSRSLTNYSIVKNELDKFKDKIFAIVSGNARGADTLGAKWADENNKRKIIYKAEWDKYGKSSGYRRNPYIIKTAHIVIAFWDEKSSGTAGAIEYAENIGKNIKIVKI